MTAAWLGRALLPRGGGTLAAVILAGLRWHLILSRWGSNMILLAPLVDLASLFALRARRKGSLLAAAAAFAAAIAGEQYGLPNGSRFGYLTGTTAIAASGGVLWILGRLRRVWRRPGAIAALGLFAALSLLGARDALAWARGRETFESFSGQDTLIGRAAARWDRFGAVRIDEGLGHPPDEDSNVTITSVRRFRLDPEEPRLIALFGNLPRRGRSFRIASPQHAALPGERPVEHVRDEWGRPWAIVLGRATPR